MKSAGAEAAQESAPEGPPRREAVPPVGARRMPMARALPVALVLAMVALPVRAREQRFVARTSQGAQATQTAAPSVAVESTCSERLPSGACVPSAPCAQGEIPIEGVCVPRQASVGEELTAELAMNSHVDRDGRLVVYEHVPRRPDLPADYNRYLYPTEPWGGTTVSSGYDLGRADAQQRRGEHMNAVGHGGVDLSQERGALVKVVSLRGQVGEAQVLYVGTLFGTTVLLQHVVREGGATRTYLALHGHLDGAAPGLRRGQDVAAGTVIGFVGDTGAEGIVHLHYETRLVRPGIDPSRTESPTELVGQAVSVPCDPRNVLPLR